MKRYPIKFAHQTRMEFNVDEKFVRELRTIQKDDLAGVGIIVNNHEIPLLDLLYPRVEPRVEVTRPEPVSRIPEMLRCALRHDTQQFQRDELFCELSDEERAATLDPEGILIYGIITYAGAPKPSQGNARWIKVECVANYKTNYHRTSRSQDDVSFWAKQLATSPFKLETHIGEAIRICGRLSKGTWIVPVEQVRLLSDGGSPARPKRNPEILRIEDLL